MIHLNRRTIPTALTSLLQQFVMFLDINCGDSSGAAPRTPYFALPIIKNKNL
jgi:hypothetical protein